MKKIVGLFTVMLLLVACVNAQSPTDLVSPKETAVQTPVLTYLTVTGKDSLGLYDAIWSSNAQLYTNDSTLVIQYVQQVEEEIDTNLLEFKLDPDKNLYKSRIGTLFGVENFRSFYGAGINIYQYPGREIQFRLFNLNRRE